VKEMKNFKKLKRIKGLKFLTILQIVCGVVWFSVGVTFVRRCEMWVNEEQTRTFEYRAKIVRLSRADFVNTGFPHGAFYKFLSLPEFNESFIRMMLSKIYGDISNWQLEVVYFDVACDLWKIRVTSPDFEPVGFGVMAPELIVERTTNGE